jgi:hypothetical protein
MHRRKARLLLEEASQLAADADKVWREAMAQSGRAVHSSSTDERHLYTLWQRREQTRRDLREAEATMKRSDRESDPPHGLPGWLRRIG